MIFLCVSLMNTWCADDMHVSRFSHIHQGGAESSRANEVVDECGALWCTCLTGGHIFHQGHNVNLGADSD